MYNESQFLNRLSDIFTLLIFTIFLAGCEKELPPHPASHYPAFYGKIAYQDSLYSPVAQEKTERVFQTPATEMVRQLTISPAAANDDTPADIILSKPVVADINEGANELYIADVETKLIHVFSLDEGTLIRIISTVKDKGETERQGVSVAVTPQGNLMVTGIKGGEYTWLDLDGKIKGTLKLESGHSLVNVADGKQVVMRVNNVDELFHVYDANHKLVDSFGYLTSKRPMAFEGKAYPGHGIGFMGYVSSDGGDSFVYDNAMGGGLAKYKLDGSLEYFRALITPGRFFGEKADSSLGGMVLDTNKRTSNIFMRFRVVDGVYYQRVLIQDKPDAQWIIDAYDYNSGDYLYSIAEANENCGTILITSQHQYVHCVDEGFFQMKRSLALESVGDGAVLAENKDQ